MGARRMRKVCRVANLGQISLRMDVDLMMEFVLEVHNRMVNTGVRRRSVADLSVPTQAKHARLYSHDKLSAQGPAPEGFYKSSVELIAHGGHFAKRQETHRTPEFRSTCPPRQKQWLKASM